MSFQIRTLLHCLFNWSLCILTYFYISFFIHFQLFAIVQCQTLFVISILRHRPKPILNDIDFSDEPSMLVLSNSGSKKDPLVTEGEAKL